MIMMLIRTALWGVAILAAAWIGHWLMTASGGVEIDLNGRVYGPFRPVQFVLFVIGLLIVIWVLWRLFGLLVAIVRFFSGDETALSRYWSRSRERRGFDALAQGLAALAEGDGRTAMVRARKAERLLSRPDLTNLLVAQAAEANGDEDTARAYYKNMAAHPATAFVGVKGLMAQAMKRGDKARALSLAAHARDLKPKSEEALTTLFALQAESGEWRGARETLAGMVRANVLPKDVAARREAVLLLAEARSLEDDDTARARDLALKANKKSPGLAPAAVDAARLSHAEGSDRRASRILKEAWRQAPHPDVAAAFAALAPDETPAERRKRFRDLTAAQPDHPEGRMLAAELALADNDYVEARRIAAELVESHPTARALSIMAAVEKGEGADDAVVRGWLAKAVAAPRGPQWICTACGTPHAKWAPRCDECSGFDTLDWRDPPATEATDELSGVMLPLVTVDVVEAAPAAPNAEAADDPAKPLERA